MRKNRVTLMTATAVLPLVLAACTAKLEVTPLLPHDYKVITNWETDDTQELAACDNRETILQYRFSINDHNRLSHIKETYTGVQNPDIAPVTRDISLNDEAVHIERSGSVDIITVTHTIAAEEYFLPQTASTPRLGASAIVVTPKPAPSVELHNGETSFKINAVYASNTSLSKPFGPDSIYLFANCD